MTTIPIEVILQDAESPVTPTPEPGEETNITVPDTGTISDEGSNSGGIGSSAGIILPAIIALLAIGAIVAIIVRRYQKRKSNTETTKLSRKEKLATVASGTIAILAVTVLVGNLVIPATKAASDDTNNNNDEGELVVEDKITITVTREEDSDEAIVSSIKNTSLATASYDFGYKVTASMTKGTTTANLYLDGNTDSPYYIAPVSDGILMDNTWGYTLSEPTEESLYLSIPLSTKPTNIVKEVAKTVEDTAVNIYYTVQIDKDMPNGTYTGELEYTIAPAIEYMQDFSTLTSAEKTATLARMTEGKQYILKDNRDEKPYYISKLADGNVWMTQNLDHDIVPTPNFYTYDNTDIGHGDTLGTTATWTGVATYPTGTTTWNHSPTTPESYDPGDLCWSGTPGSDTTESCSQSGSHYHLGNYYNWTAAVAMSNSDNYTLDNTDVNQSICPAGWMLPKSGDELTDSGSFQYLVDQAELSAGTEGNIQNYPTYFVYGGYWYGDSNGYNYGRYWSSVVQYSHSAYQLDFNVGNSLLPQGSDNRFGAFSVRCLAR